MSLDCVLPSTEVHFQRGCRRPQRIREMVSRNSIVRIKLHKWGTSRPCLDKVTVHACPVPHGVANRKMRCASLDVRFVSRKTVKRFDNKTRGL